MRTSIRITSASLLLLGTETPPGNLDPVSLRRAYRRMALLTHPDTRVHTGAPDFLRVRQAFEVLVAHLRTGGAGRVPSQESPSRGPSTAKAPPKPWYWAGKVPRRPLRLGEYLFYRGAIPWDVLIQAIVRQKGARPNFGTLASLGGHVTQPELASGLRGRRPGERLGDALVRLGLLEAAAVEALLEEQRRMQRPLGWHLVRMGSVPGGQIPALLAGLWRHNGSLRSPVRSPGQDPRAAGAPGYRSRSRAAG
jgi:hypothetical protein